MLKLLFLKKILFTAQQEGLFSIGRHSNEYVDVNKQKDCIVIFFTFYDICGFLLLLENALFTVCTSSGGSAA